MARWQPSVDDMAMVKLIASMCIDALGGKGVEDRETFIGNPILMAEKMEEA